MIDKAKELRNTSDLRIKKLKEQHTEEINEVKVQNLKLQEELGNVVKERQRLKESERILVQTFDTLKMYYEKPENMAQCSQCGLTCASESELKKHKLSMSLMIEVSMRIMQELIFPALTERYINVKFVNLKVSIKHRWKNTLKKRTPA